MPGQWDVVTYVSIWDVLPTSGQFDRKTPCRVCLAEILLVSETGKQLKVYINPGPLLISFEPFSR
jgi:hypothetical protein